MFIISTLGGMGKILFVLWKLPAFNNLLGGEGGGEKQLKIWYLSDCLHMEHHSWEVFIRHESFRISKI